MLVYCLLSTVGLVFDVNNILKKLVVIARFARDASLKHHIYSYNYVYMYEKAETKVRTFECSFVWSYL